MGTKKTIINFCSCCERKTQHTIIKETTVKIDPTESNDCEEYQIVKCCGCENISFRYIFNDVDNSDRDFDTGEWFIPRTIDCYPKTIQNYQQTFNESQLPEVLQEIYRETKSSIANDNILLAGAGLRAIIDAICIDKEIKGATLSEKIDNLALLGHIPITQRDFLHGLRLIGNDSIHGMEETPTKDLVEALKIVDTILNSLYILPVQSRKLPKAVITTYPRFKRLLISKIEGLTFDTEYSLSDILGSDYRRVKNYISNFIETLHEEIETGKIKELTFEKKQKESEPIRDKSKAKGVQMYKRVSGSK